MAVALAFASPALADPYPTPIKVSAGPLSRTLQEIARQSGGELLFDHNTVAGLQARKIDANTTVLAAVQAALAGTKLNVRRVASGALIIEPPTAPPLARPDVAVSEVLVIGRNSQNADIRRSQTDIQPYHVITSDQMTSAHVDTIGEYFDTRVPSNANVLIVGTANEGDSSQINLRGLGTDETLVLIDGRRMPGYPTVPTGFTQPDINALALHSIDRMEVLTGTAGGIYGLGALGGVVNVVLAHDRPGAELHITTGLSSRGDAGHVSFEGRVEFSPDHGATDVTIDAGLSRFQPLTAGERDYLTRDAQIAYKSDPSEVVAFSHPHGDSVGVFDAFYVENLVLKPEYGGAALGAPYTYLPNGFAGTTKDLGAALQSRAGQVDLGLSKQAGASYLESNPELGSLLFNVRHKFSGGFEVYLDGVMLWNRDKYIDHGVNAGLDGELILDPSSPYNPFEQEVVVTFPTDRSFIQSSTEFDSSRFTMGVVAPLPFEWRATAEAARGDAHYREAAAFQYYDLFLSDDVNPFGGQAQLSKAVANDAVYSSETFKADTQLLEQSLRLAGPVFRTPAGPATVTVLAEHRSEDVPGYFQHATGELSFVAGPVASRSTSTTSVYAELRAQIFADKAPSLLLRGLEVQVAVRNDNQSDDFALDPTLPGSARMHVSFAGTSYVVGAKISPLSWLMLRGSFATGETPPPLQDLVEKITPVDFGDYDPKRGGFGDLYIYTDKAGGSPNLKNIVASTASFGFVLTPSSNFRFSIDYSHIRKTHDVELLNDFLVLDHEDDWPQRVQRGPLTDADKALGYTAGPVTAIDETAINGDIVDVQTIDARFDWSFAAPVGWLHLFGASTYYFDNEKKDLFEPSVRYDGYSGGPLKWRSNVGVDWSVGSLTIGADAQYFSGYLVDLFSGYDDDIGKALQGSDRIPPQVYLDLHIRRRVHLRDTDLRIDFGVSNLLDTSPPLEYSLQGLGNGYSLYGDPRRRRFELSVSALF